MFIFLVGIVMLSLYILCNSSVQCLRKKRIACYRKAMPYVFNSKTQVSKMVTHPSASAEATQAVAAETAPASQPLGVFQSVGFYLTPNFGSTFSAEAVLGMAKRLGFQENKFGNWQYVSTSLAFKVELLVSDGDKIIENFAQSSGEAYSITALQFRGSIETGKEARLRFESLFSMVEQAAQQLDASVLDEEQKLCWPSKLATMVQKLEILPYQEGASSSNLTSSQGAA